MHLHKARHRTDGQTRERRGGGLLSKYPSLSKPNDVMGNGKREKQ